MEERDGGCIRERVRHRREKRNNGLSSKKEENGI